MKTNLFLTVLAGIIVIVLNFPGLILGFLAPVQVTAATIVVFVLLICYQTFALFSQKKKKAVSEHKVPKTEVSDKDVPKLPVYCPGQHIDELLSAIMDAYTTLPDTESKLGEAERQRLSNELDVYRQSYLWCVKMQEQYGRKWSETFQGATLPLTPGDYPAMRSLMAEIAVQTADFCRYRTGDINLTDRMTVNPRMVLLGCTPQQAGAQPLSDNPFQIPKEVLALNEFFGYDGIKLCQASIHGFIP